MLPGQRESHGSHNFLLWYRRHREPKGLRPAWTDSIRKNMIQRELERGRVPAGCSKNKIGMAAGAESVKPARRYWHSPAGVDRRCAPFSQTPERHHANRPE